MQRVPLLVALGASTLLASCNQQQPGLADEKAAEALAENDAAGDPRPAAAATLGPLRFEYDNTQLTLAELPIDLPPDYEDEAWALKLIPAERARLLGQQGCRYGQSGEPQICNVEDEAGLLLALLERPLSDYRRAFVEDDLAAALEPAQIDGAQGFRFVAQAEGSGIDYRFVAVEERTLLVARQFRRGRQLGAEPIQQVIDSVAQELTESTG